MKGIIVLALCLLAGCTAGPTLEQLERQALVTGDWSLVEKREAAIARRKARGGIDCPAGYIAYCDTGGRLRAGGNGCSCVEAGEIYSLISY